MTENGINLSPKPRWALTVALAVLQPLVLYFLYPFMGSTINSVSFIPPVIATLFFGFSIGLVFAVISVFFTGFVFFQLTALPHAEGLPRAALSLAVTCVLCYGAAKIRHYLKERRRAEEALRHRERQYRTIFEHSADGIVCLDKDGVVIEASPRVEMHLGWPVDAFVGRRFDTLDALNDDGKRAIRRLLEMDTLPSTTTALELQGRNSDGAPVLVECSVACIPDAENPTKWIILLKNATGRRSMEAELHQAKKMEAIGRLAGGVAHDMNNTLNAIMGSAFALRHELARYHRSFEDLDNLTAACDRGAQLTQNLLGFARKSSYIKQTFSLNSVLETVLALLRRTASKRIHIDMRLEPDLPPMQGDIGRIENAILNLCLNALDAMNEEGRLTLTTQVSDAFVTVTVADTGAGMDEMVQEQIFEPFFTTKPAGKGTGLGLSMVYGVVQAHGGKIGLESAPGKGTSVTLAFNQATQPHAGRRDEATSAPPPPPDAGELLRGNTILVIDDEPLVLRAAHRVLSTLGCEVLRAQDGFEGIEQLKANGHRISLILLDLIMPEMDGTATLERIHRLNPDIPVLLASGYTDEADKIDALRETKPNVAFIAKPYRSEKLVAAIQRLIEPATDEQHPERVGQHPQRPVEA